MKVFCFRIGPEGYAVETDQVVEVVNQPEVSPVPGGPVFLKGVFLYRTYVVPLFNEAKVLGTKNTETARTRLLVIKGPEGLFGIEAEMEGVFEVEAQPHDVPSNVPEKRRTFLKGLIKKGDSIYGLINIDSFVLDNLRSLEV